MPRAVVCPNCLVELDIPEELFGQPVRCATCATVFTPSQVAAAPVARPRRSLDRAESRNTALDEVQPGRPRAKPSGAGRGLFAVVSLLLAGTFGVCCLGCVGLLVVGQRLDDPAMQAYKSPDGQFEAVFPGVPSPAPLTLSDGTKLLGVAHSRRMMGQEFDNCSVRYFDLPKAPKTDAARDAVLATTAKAVVGARAFDFTVDQEKTTVDGYPALEITAQDADPQVEMYARIVLADKRVYVVTYEGRGLAPQSQRLDKFWTAFRVLKPDAPGEKGKGR